MKKSKGTPKQYLEMWLSEQITTPEWIQILEQRSDVKKAYHEHLEKRNV